MRKCFILMLGLILSMSAFDAMAQTSYVEETIVRPQAQVERKLFCGSKDRPVRIASFVNYPPFGWREYVKEGANSYAVYRGVGVEIFKRFAEEFDIQYSFVDALNNDEVKMGLYSGAIDLLLTDYYDTNAYNKIRTLYPGYMSNPVVIVMRKPSPDEKEPPRFKNFADLSGKKGYIRVEEGIAPFVYPQLPSDVNIKKITGVRRAFKDLLNKQVDFLIMSQYAFEAEKRRFKISDYVETTSKPLVSPFIFISYAQDNACAYYIKNALEAKLKDYAQNEKMLKMILSSQLRDWENEFINEKSLMFETDISEEADTTSDFNAWVKQQKQSAQTVMDNVSAAQQSHEQVSQ